MLVDPPEADKIRSERKEREERKQQEEDVWG
jgi:hypothetical protein